MQKSPRRETLIDMSPIDNKELVLKSLNASLQNMKLYPPGHPSAAAATKKCFQLLSNALKGSSEFFFGIVDEALVVENIPIIDAEANFPDLMEHLNTKGIEAVIFRSGLTEKEIAGLFEIFSIEGELDENAIRKELESRSIVNITIKAIPTEKSRYLAVYNDALDAVKNVMNKIRAGQVPDTEEVNAVAEEMSELVLSDTNAMVGLTMIKNYDNYLYNHSVNVSILALALGRFLKLDKNQLHFLGVGSLLHDVGKTGLAEDIIKKPGGLSSDEWEKIKQHPVMGKKIISEMDAVDPLVERICYEHHVRFDRSGYPDYEDDIHLLSMIVSIADAYDALTTLRVYQKPHHPVEALKILKSLSGKHFDPKMLKSFENMIGLYPVGTMIRLSTNEIGIVTRINREHSELPIIKILYGPDGSKLDEPVELDLLGKKDSISIIAPVDPLSRNMDTGAFFENEAANMG